MNPQEPVMVLAIVYALLTAGMFGGILWAIHRTEARRETHLRDVLDRFLAKNLDDLRRTRLLLEERAAEEVQQQESEDLDDPETIARMVREAEAAFAKSVSGQNGED